MKNEHLSHLDPNQISTLEHDASIDAKRVIIVGGADLSINEEKIALAIKEGIGSIKLNNQSNQIQVIEKNVFIPQIEIREIEKQIIIPQIEYKEIRIPVIIEKIVTVEKPIVIKEIEIKEIEKERHYPTVLKICAVVQAIAVTILLISNLLRK